MLALALGAPGLFLVAFLDSSFLSLPEVADLLVVWMVTRTRRAMLLYVVSATLGSLAGCLVLYYIGRKGGEAFVDSGSAGQRRAHAGRLQRYGVMAVLIPSLLPPPAPFKIFVLLAGVADISVAAVLARHRDRRGASATSPKACWRSGTASGRSPSSASNGTPWRSRSSPSLAVGGRRSPDLPARGARPSATVDKLPYRWP